MKTIFLYLIILTISINSIAQKITGKGNDKNKSPHSGSHNESSDNSSQKGNAKNQPKKVQAALLRDYPAAKNVTWSKYKGDYTATFYNGIWKSTAIYHANGDRRDTRTIVPREQLPGSIWDKIFKRDKITPTEYILIERPSNLEKIFRILSPNNTVNFYDQHGNKITYNY